MIQNSNFNSHISELIAEKYWEKVVSKLNGAATKEAVSEAQVQIQIDSILSGLEPKYGSGFCDRIRNSRYEIALHVCDCLNRFLVAKITKDFFDGVRKDGE